MMGDLVDATPRDPVMAAKKRAEQIRKGMVTYVETLQLVADAYAAHDWEPLGYESWDSYVEAEFGAMRVKLDVEQRRRAVEALRLAGMSTRAIGVAVGASEATVRRDLEAGASNDAPAPERVTGADGKSYPAQQPEPVPAEASAAERRFCEVDGCGTELPPDEAANGFRRCSECDSEGEHVAGEDGRCMACYPRQDEGEAKSFTPDVKQDMAAEVTADTVLAALEGTSPYGLTIEEIADWLDGADVTEIQRVLDELAAAKRVFTTNAKETRWIRVQGEFVDEPVSPARDEWAPEPAGGGAVVSATPGNPSAEAPAEADPEAEYRPWREHARGALTRVRQALIDLTGDLRDADTFAQRADGLLVDDLQRLVDDLQEFVRKVRGLRGPEPRTVWIAARRKGIEYHRLNRGLESTACGRSTRTGFTNYEPDEVRAHFGGKPCPRCWPPDTSESGGPQ